jgi:hypothetical protein
MARAWSSLVPAEVVRLMVQEGMLTQNLALSQELPGHGAGPGLSLRIREGAREVIAKRLNRLSPQCNRMPSEVQHAIAEMMIELERFLRSIDARTGVRGQVITRGSDCIPSRVGSTFVALPGDSGGLSQLAPTALLIPCGSMFNGG